MVAQERINVREAVGRKNNCKVSFFSMYFVRTNEEIHLSFKNSEKQWTQALTTVLQFFKTHRSLVKLFNKHSWYYLHLKILSATPAYRNLSIDLFYKINWLVSIICDHIFRESLMRNSYSCCQSSQLL